MENSFVVYVLAKVVCSRDAQYNSEELTLRFGSVSI